MPTSAPIHVEFLLSSLHHARPFAADARFQPTGQPKPVVVFVHGFKGFKDWGHFNVLADYFAAHNFVFVKLNLSHNGVVPGGTGDLEDMEAFGRNNFSLELNDLGTLLDYLHEPATSVLPAAEVDLSRIYLVGHSRGGGIVLLKAAEDARVKAVAGWAPISSVNPRWPEPVMQQWQQDGVQYIENARTKQRMPLYYQLVEDYHANQQRLDIAGNVRDKLHQPLLIVHGDQDETLPVQMAHDLKSYKPDAELVIVPGAGHMFGGKHPWDEDKLPELAQGIADKTIEFFRAH
ncbi:alpha/beta hydrolase family protein [Hymenobacter cellulosivorans]|uniref:Dienelactone hydrolase family protein n=1 Tax=Hymenobacter cellulosivorans TaxID=2932249 RepID=A0ABY4FFQ3_9BACT|nr:alpha/beta fold hydrolase [Hymenobacter cellulosivorans]UOQ55523.1 dienelactone hydrolase family protein [Hymenobacter cellulosivorans]